MVIGAKFIPVIHENHTVLLKKYYI
jgi:hypothetical protein